MSNEKKDKDNVQVTESNKQEAEVNQVEESSTNVPDKDTNKINTSASVVTTSDTDLMTAEDLEALNYTDFDTPAKMMVLAGVLIKSQLVPLKRKEDVVVAMLTGKRLGISFDVAVSQIYPINGRATIGVHIIRGIILARGIWFECIRIAEEYYEFAEEQVTNTGEKKFAIVSYGFLNEQPPNTKRLKKDVRTVYNFEREIKLANGKFKTLKVQSSFGYNDAYIAGYLDKDVWVKQFPRMLDARAFTIGAKQIADDYLQGIPSTDEMLDVKGKTYFMNEDGSVTLTTED